MDYTIKRGDTLSDLARRFDTTVDKLAQDNHIANPNLIHEGATLSVAESSAPASPAPATPAPQDAATVSPQAKGEIQMYQAQDLGKVVHRAREATQVAPATPRERPVTPPPAAPAAPAFVLPQSQPFGADVAPGNITVPTQPEAPATPPVAAGGGTAPKPEKGWFDSLVEGGEDMVANTVGKIPLIGGLFTMNAQITGGALKAAGDMVGGVASAVAHPINTLKGLWGLAAHIPFSPPNLLHVANEAMHGKGVGDILKEEGDYSKGLWNGLTAGYQASIQDGRWAEVPGRLVVDVGSLLIGAGEAGGAAKVAAVAGKAADVTKATEIAAVAGKAADLTKATEAAAIAGKAADVTKATEAAAVAGKAADLTKATEAAAIAGKATEVTGRVAQAVQAFKASTLGRAVLDVTAGLELMGDSVGEFAKAMIKGIKESAGKLPAADLAKVELLANQSELLAKDFQAASKLEGAAAVERMSELAKRAGQLAHESEQLGNAGKGIKGMASALKTRANVALDAFSNSGAAGHLVDLGAMSVETAKAMGELGLEFGRTAIKGAGKLPRAAVQQLRSMGNDIGLLASRAKSAGALRGEAAVNALSQTAERAHALAQQAAALAKTTGDATIAELASKLSIQEASLRKATAIASLGIPLNAAEAARVAVE